MEKEKGLLITLETDHIRRSIRLTIGFLEDNLYCFYSLSGCCPGAFLRDLASSIIVLIAAQRDLFSILPFLIFDSRQAEV